MDNRNDYYNQIPNKQSWEYRYYRNTKLANAFFFAALAGLFLGTLILPFIFAPLCIIFAYLAKGNRERSEKYNLFLILISVFIILVNTGYCAYTAYRLTHDDTFKNQLNQAYESVYGMDFNDYLNQITGNTLENGGVDQ